MSEPEVLGIPLSEVEKLRSIMGLNTDEQLIEHVKSVGAGERTFTPGAALACTILCVRFVQLQEELEKERTKTIWGFYEEEFPIYTQGSEPLSELHEEITADEANNLVQRIRGLIEVLRAHKKHHDDYSEDYGWHGSDLHEKTMGALEPYYPFIREESDGEG